MEQLIYFLETLIRKRVEQIKSNSRFIEGMPRFDIIVDSSTPLGKFIKGRNLDLNEYVILGLSIIAYVNPSLILRLRKEIEVSNPILFLLGIKDPRRYGGFLPTGETALFLLCENDLQKRFEIQQIFGPDHFFAKERILWLAPPEKNEPPMSGQIVMNPKYVELFTTGKEYLPRFSMDFPAERLETQMEWDDLVLQSNTLMQLDELKNWLQHKSIIMQEWGMEKILKPGYRALFYGPPGTGKTLTAALLGKEFNRPVFRIDLSMVVSKYIGETEKNLSNLFAEAERTDWILFFDEADALFGKRTGVRDAHDRYANQEVAYLLQRIEHYDGLVILASNLKSNIDEAFLRRFQSITYFPIPGPTERLQIWKNSLPANVHLADDIDLPYIAQKYELSGSGIVNVVQFCCLRAVTNKDSKVFLDDMIAGIRKEFAKYSKVV